MLEKRFAAVPPQAFTADGTDRGIVTIADTSLFKVKQQVILMSPNVALEVKKVISPTQMMVGPISPDINTYQDISAYTVAGSAFIFANEQKRPSIPFEESTRAVYEEEPTVAVRTVLVDKYGNKISEGNPLPVQVDTTLNIGDVRITAHDNEPNMGNVHSSVRIGDGEDEATVTPAATGSVAGLDVVNKAKVFTKPYNKVTILTKNDDGDPLTIRTRYNGVDVQLATIVYDSDGDFQDVEVTDL